MITGMKKIIVITGPTACGKTPTAIALAKLIDGEIISADSMQIYKGMDIGTAKPDLSEMDGIPHHMLDIADPSENFSAALFQKMSRKVVADIQSRGKSVIVAGGTGFYINALLYDNLSPDADDSDLRDRLMKESNLHERLKAVDPISAEAIHPNNIKRLARALAYYEVNAHPFSNHKSESKKPLYDTAFYILHRGRSLLYKAIDHRVEVMINRGLVDEVKRLLAEGLSEKSTAMQALGYKEMLPYIKGQCSLEEAVAAIQQGSRRYAKRQLTWFRHQIDGVWLSMEEYSPTEAARKIAKNIKT